MARNNLGSVVSFEVIRTLTRRWFWITTLIVPIAFGVVMALVVSANTTTQSQIQSQQTARFTFTYSDASGYVNPAVVAALGGSKTADEVEALADVKSGRIDAYFAYPSDPVNLPTKVYGVDSGIFENGKYAAVARHILVASIRDEMGDTTRATLLQGDFLLAATTYREGRASGEINEVVPPLLLVVVFYLVIVLLGNQMTTSLLEEKENRVTEMILTTLGPATLVAGKVISLFIIGALQMLVFILPAVVGYRFFHDALNLPHVDLSHLVLNPGPMIVGALLLLGGFTLFTASFVAVGAIMPTARDAGQISAPLAMLTFVPLWAVSLVVSDPRSFIVRLLTFFPYTAPVTAMLRNGFGSLRPLEATIVIAELFCLGILMLRLAVRLFRYGSIEYTRKVRLRAALAKRK